MNRITVIVFGVILSISLFTQWLPDKTFSDQENRYLQTMPRLTWDNIVSGRFTSGFEAYIQDHFFLRDEWIKEKTSLEQIIGKQESNGVYLGKDGWYFEVDQTIDHTQLQTNLDRLSDFVSWLDENAMPTSFLPIYSSYMYYQELLPTNHVNIDQETILKQLQSKLRGLSILQSYDDLMKQKDQKIYFQTDHHWTQLGAYYAYEALAKQMNWNVTPLSMFEEARANTAFFGTLYSKAPRRNQGGDEFMYYMDSQYTYTVTIPETNRVLSSLYDAENLAKKDKYSTFLGGNYGVTIIERNSDPSDSMNEIDSTARTNQTLVVFKDSYSHALAPFLAQHYDKIVLIDMRYFNGSIRDYVGELQPDHVMFAYNLSWFANDTNLGKWKR